jgi:hypothetical protein
MPLRLKDLDCHVVHVVLHEVQHPLQQSVGSYEGSLELEFLGALVEEPSLAELSLDVLAEEQVAED